MWWIPATTFPLCNTHPHSSSPTSIIHGGTLQTQTTHRGIYVPTCTYLVQHRSLERNSGQPPVEGSLSVGGDQHDGVVADVRVPDLGHASADHKKPEAELDSFPSTWYSSTKMLLYGIQTECSRAPVWCSPRGRSSLAYCKGFQPSSIFPATNWDRTRPGFSDGAPSTWHCRCPKISVVF